MVFFIAFSAPFAEGWASFLKCFLGFKLNFLCALEIPAKKPLSLVSEFFDLIFILNFVYASQFVFYVVVYSKTIRQLGFFLTDSRLGFHPRRLSSHRQLGLVV